MVLSVSTMMTLILAPMARDAALAAESKTTYYTIANFVAHPSHFSLELENNNSF